MTPYVLLLTCYVLRITYYALRIRSSVSQKDPHATIQEIRSEQHQKCAAEYKETPVESPGHEFMPKGNESRYETVPDQI